MEPNQRIAVVRILDANANRAREGLRVIEEYARFCLDDAHLTRLLKDTRHDLQSALKVMEGLDDVTRQAARRPAQMLAPPLPQRRKLTEPMRTTWLPPGFHRVAEALRCLEEYGKSLQSQVEFSGSMGTSADGEPSFAARIEALR